VQVTSTSGGQTPSTIRVGVAGLGRAGWGLHIAALAQLQDNYMVSAVADPGADRRQKAAARLGCRTYEHFGQFAAAADIDLIVIATPSHRHASQALMALANGKHVLVEKPFATSAGDAEAVIVSARRAQRLAMASQNLRYTADFMKVQQVLASGVLGEVIQISVRRHAFRRRWDWQTLRAHGGGIINNDASHVVDQVLTLLGDQQPAVFCSIRRLPLALGDAEDYAKIILTAPGWPLVDLELSNGCAFPQDQWLVCGAYGSLTGGPAGVRWRYIDPGALPAREVARRSTADRTYNSEDLSWTEQECLFPQETYGTSHVRLYQEIHRAITNNEPSKVDARTVHRQIAILDECRSMIS
jgi:scyllo-inositol 2-dehydrogenase (NADP+)